VNGRTVLQGDAGRLTKRSEARHGERLPGRARGRASLRPGWGSRPHPLVTRAFGHCAWWVLGPLRSMPRFREGLPVHRGGRRKLREAQPTLAQVVEPMVAITLGLLLAVAAFSGLTAWLIRQA